MPKMWYKGYQMTNVSKQSAFYNEHARPELACGELRRTVEWACPELVEGAIIIAIIIIGAAP